MTHFVFYAVDCTVTCTNVAPYAELQSCARSVLALNPHNQTPVRTRLTRVFAPIVPPHGVGIACFRSERQVKCHIDKTPVGLT